MNETHDNAMFIRPEPGVHDGCFLVTKQRCPVEIAALNARLAALGEPSASFQIRTMQMGLIRPTQTGEEWRQMIDEIRECTKGGDAVPLKNSSEST